MQAVTVSPTKSSRHNWCCRLLQTDLYNVQLKTYTIAALTADCPIDMDYPAALHFPSTCSNREALGISGIGVSFLSSNNTEENSKHWCWPLARTHPFFVYHLTPEGTGVAPFMLDLPMPVPYVFYTFLNKQKISPIRGLTVNFKVSWHKN